MKLFLKLKVLSTFHSFIKVPQSIYQHKKNKFVQGLTTPLGTDFRVLDIS